MGEKLAEQTVKLLHLLTVTDSYGIYLLNFDVSQWFRLLFGPLSSKVLQNVKDYLKIALSKRIKYEI